MDLVWLACLLSFVCGQVILAGYGVGWRPAGETPRERATEWPVTAQRSSRGWREREPEQGAEAVVWLPY
jgi:hypothetical protein